MKVSEIGLTYSDGSGDALQHTNMQRERGAGTAAGGLRLTLQDVR